MNIKPFKALRPAAILAKELASRPYDVLNSAEARTEVIGNPNSFLHITKSEIDLPESTDIHSKEVYDKARENILAFQDRKILIRETKPCFYIYQLDMGTRSQTGLVAVSSVDDYENNHIKKHEFTRPEKELDRINHIKTTGAQTGNVFLAYKANDEVHTIIESWKSGHPPVYEFIANDGIKHTVWIVDMEETIKRIEEIFASRIANTYIADGHHRAASAAKVRKALGSEATADSDYFLTTLFPSNQLHILDYNRLVKDMNGMDEEELLDALENDFLVGRVDKAFSPERLHEFGMYLQGHWYKLVAKDNAYSPDPIGVLDVTILQNRVLDRLFAITDPRTDTRIDFVGGIRGLAELEKRVDSREMKVAFSLYPVGIDQLFAIADMGEVMPPKSTWFEPKLRDGLLTHLIF